MVLFFACGQKAPSVPLTPSRSPDSPHILSGCGGQ